MSKTATDLSSNQTVAGLKPVSEFLSRYYKPGSNQTVAGLKHWSDVTDASYKLSSNQTVAGLKQAMKL